MPATFARVPKYTAPDGQQFDTLDEEMIHELVIDDKLKLSKETAEILVAERGKVISVLRQHNRRNTSPKTRKPRKTAGKNEGGEAAK